MAFILRHTKLLIRPLLCFISDEEKLSLNDENKSDDFSEIDYTVDSTDAVKEGVNSDHQENLEASTKTNIKIEKPTHFSLPKGTLKECTFCFVLWKSTGN